MSDVVKVGVRLFIITLVASVFLGVVNAVTKPIIDNNNRLAKEAAMSEVFPGASALKFSDEIKTGSETGVTAYCEAEESGVFYGYVFFVTRKGDQGPISVVVGINKDGLIEGVKLVSHSETPGLGANAEKPEFLSQYSGKSGIISVVKSGNAGQNSIVAITSATNTSVAVTDSVNDAVKAFAGLPGNK